MSLTDLKYCKEMLASVRQQLAAERERADTLERYLDSASAFTVGDYRVVSLLRGAWCFEKSRGVTVVANSLAEIIAAVESVIDQQSLQDQRDTEIQALSDTR